MDAIRYGRVRELFLAAEELPADEQLPFLQVQTGDDVELLAEVTSLLAEHHPEQAHREGQCVTPPPLPPSQDEARPAQSRRRSARGADSTQRDGADRRSDRNKTSQITRQSAERTHAAPRYPSKSVPRRHTPAAMLWAERTRRRRRRTSGWLWLAALLPTALIGWWTYRYVDAAMERSVRNQLKGVADSVTLAAERYLDDQAQLILSWSRQPSIRGAIEELVSRAESNDSADQLRQAVQADRIENQLQELSGSADLSYVIWSDSYRVLAAGASDRGDVGQPVQPSDASNLTRVLSGETVVFGPRRRSEKGSDARSQVAQPVMAMIVPIQNDHGKVIAAMMIRGLEWFQEFSRLFADVTEHGSLDVYAISGEGLMLTDSPHAVSLATQNRLDLPAGQIAGILRVADPGFELTGRNIDKLRRQIRPLTIAVAGVTSGQTEVRTEPYSNYAGESVIGAWRWSDDWRLGVVIEQDAGRAFAAARTVGLSFLLLGSLLSLTAFVAAAKIARTSTAERAAVHPLSRYEILGELGSGGMGVVYRARHRQLGRDTALKILRGDRHHQEDRLRFEREAKLAASLGNPHSVTIYDYGHSDEGEAYCVMEFLRGLTLQEVVARSGHQPIGRVLCIVRQICDALSEAHGMQLVHRDIKPQNVMLSLDAAVGDWAVVFDYGLAKPLEADAGVYQTAETIWAGTPMYMAPERFRAPSEMDPRSDIYSVGCVIYYLLSGRAPFIECDPESLFALIISEQPLGIAIHRGEEVPTEISEMVLKCMSKSADDRYDNIEQLSRVIDQLRSKYSWTVDEARVWWQHHGAE